MTPFVPAYQSCSSHRLCLVLLVLPLPLPSLLLMPVLMQAGAQWGASGIDVPNYPGSLQVQFACLTGCKQTPLAFPDDMQQTCRCIIFRHAHMGFLAACRAAELEQIPVLLVLCKVNSDL